MKISGFKEGCYSFLKIADRLMEIFGIKNLKDLNAAFGVNCMTFSTWLRRDKIHYELLVFLSSVEKSISLDWLVLGDKSKWIYWQEKVDGNVVINSYANKALNNINILTLEDRLKDNQYLSFSKNIFEKFTKGENFNGLRMITVLDTFMSLMINHGDKVFISSSCKDKEIYNNIIYPVIYNDRTYIKPRIQINPANSKILRASDSGKHEAFKTPMNRQKDFKTHWQSDLQVCA